MYLKIRREILLFFIGVALLKTHREILIFCMDAILLDFSHHYRSPPYSSSNKVPYLNGLRVRDSTVLSTLFISTTGAVP